MSSTYNLTNAFVDAITVPSDGDDDGVAVVDAAIEAVADNSKHLEQQLYDRWYDVPLARVDTNQSIDRFGFSTSKGVWVQNNITDTGEMWFSLVHLPPGASFKQARFVLNGGGAAHAGLPATMPEMVVEEYKDGVAQGEVFDFVDTSGTLGAYEVVHTVTSAVLSPTTDLDTASVYYVWFKGETGTNSLANAVELYRMQIYVERA